MSPASSRSWDYPRHPKTTAASWPYSHTCNDEIGLAAPPRRVAAVIKYLGSKRLPAPSLAEIARRTGGVSAAGLFAGPTRGGPAPRAARLRGLSEDTAGYSPALGPAP